MVRWCKSLVISLILVQSLCGQVSQDCSSAIPICHNTPVNGGTLGYGTDDFNGAQTSGCLERTASGAIESNSAWYQFRTSASGQLGINIGHDSAEDWDFALYRANDCNDLGAPIRCNFFDNRDQNAFIGIGADPSGDMTNVQYEDWLQVRPGENYYLMINNFSNNNAGFSIQFSGDVFVTNPNDAIDCSIISNLLGPPIAACDNETVVLDATTMGAVSYTWYEDLGSGFNEISGATNATLQVLQDAVYRVRVVTPTETITSDVQVAFTPVPVTAVVADIRYCYDGANPSFDLGALDVAAKGTQNPQDYRVSYHSSASDANLGINPLPKDYLKVPGNETIYIRTTSVQNPDCYDAFQSFQLHAVEVPLLSFNEDASICEDSPLVTIGEEYPNPNFIYEWDTGEQTPTITVSASGAYTLTVTNGQGLGACSDSRTVNVVTSTTPTILPPEISDLSSNNTVTIHTQSEGEFEYQLDNGPFQQSNVFTGVLPGEHTLTIRNLVGCGTFTDTIIVAGFNNHFSPNGDVLNETWQIDGLEVLDQPVVHIYDRYGKLLKQMPGSASWDGIYNGRLLPATDYWFKLTYVDPTGNRVEAKYIQNHFSLRR